MFKWLFGSSDDDDVASYDAGKDAQTDWYLSSADGIHPSDVPDGVIRHMARQNGYGEDDYLEGWRVEDKATERMEKVVDFWSRLFG